MVGLTGGFLYDIIGTDATKVYLGFISLFLLIVIRY